MNLLIGENREAVVSFVKCCQKKSCLLEIEDNSFGSPVTVVGFGTFCCMEQYSLTADSTTILLEDIKKISKDDQVELNALLFLYPVLSVRRECISKAAKQIEELFHAKFDPSQTIVCLINCAEVKEATVDVKKEQMLSLSSTVVLWDSEAPLKMQFDDLKNALTKPRKTVILRLSELAHRAVKLKQEEGREQEQPREGRRFNEQPIVSFRKTIRFRHQEDRSYYGVFNIFPGLLLPYVWRVFFPATYTDVQTRNVQIPSGPYKVKSVQWAKVGEALAGGEVSHYSSRIGEKTIEFTSVIKYRCCQFGNYWVEYEITYELVNE
jgi:hypothetical protein